MPHPLPQPDWFRAVAPVSALLLTLVVDGDDVEYNEGLHLRREGAAAAAIPSSAAIRGHDHIRSYREVLRSASFFCTVPRRPHEQDKAVSHVKVCMASWHAIHCFSVEAVKYVVWSVYSLHNFPNHPTLSGTSPGLNPLWTGAWSYQPCSLNMPNLGKELNNSRMPAHTFVLSRTNTVGFHVLPVRRHLWPITFGSLGWKSQIHESMKA